MDPPVTEVAWAIRAPVPQSHNGAMRVLSTMGERVASEVTEAVPGTEVVTVPGDAPLGPEAEGDVLLTMHRSAALVGMRARVPWVHMFGTGVDGTPAETFDGRIVTCSRGAGTVPIAEFVLAAMLAFEKRLPETWVSEPPEHWGWTRLGGLHGKALAVVGLGSIGTRVAELGLAFGMQVSAVRRTDAPTPLAGVELVSDLTQLVSGADHLVVSAPATPTTHHLIGDDVFAAMRDGAHLINIARGALVDQDALRLALDSGRVGRATLDACDPEPLPEGHWLYDHPQVRLSPHVSWSSPELTARILELFIDNLRARAEGAPLGGVVDPAEGY